MNSINTATASLNRPLTLEQKISSALYFAASNPHFNPDFLVSVAAALKARGKISERQSTALDNIIRGFKIPVDTGSGCLRCGGRLVKMGSARKNGKDLPGPDLNLLRCHKKCYAAPTAFVKGLKGSDVAAQTAAASA